MEIKGREFIAQLAARAGLGSTSRELPFQAVVPGRPISTLLRRLLRLAVQLEPLLLLLLIPSVPVPQKLLYIGLVVPAIVWLCSRFSTGHYIARTPVDWPAAILLAAAGLSQVTGMNPDYSLPKVTFFAWGVIAFYTISRFVSDRPRLRWATLAYLLLGGWMMVIGLFGTETAPAKAPYLAAITDAIPDVITQLWGYSTDPNNLAASLALFVPVQAMLLLAWFAQPKTGPRAWLLPALLAAGLALGLAILVLSQSRATLLALLAGTASLAAWRVARTHRRLAAALVIGCAIAVSLIPHIYAQSTPEPGSDIASMESLVWRHLIWIDLLPVLRDYPWIGLGIVRIREALPVLYPVASLSEVTLMMKETHNQYLEIAVSFGLPALIAYLALWLGVGRMLLVAHRWTASPWLRALVEGLAAALLVNFIYGLTGATMLNAKIGICLWVSLGLAAGAFRVAAAEKARDAPSPAG